MPMNWNGAGYKMNEHSSDDIRILSLYNLSSSGLSNWQKVRTPPFLCPWCCFFPLQRSSRCRLSFSRRAASTLREISAFCGRRCSCEFQVQSHCLRWPLVPRTQSARCFPSHLCVSFPFSPSPSPPPHSRALHRVPPPPPGLPHCLYV